ncbi:winged helix-turn-helix domain-containing protein [Geoglobus acetivorans]|uniref:ArnR1-like winged helix-turn-helix domain-containing protein n=1 Tax=Geoglobus acetivorans TaxID=565033 RepID=A0A0A7GBN4_GEOAI|nr:hypothetical protein GACE_0407 [Geoglobus acetivorans]
MLSGNMLRVLALLEHGDMDFTSIKKSVRISEKMLESVIARLVEQNFINKEGETYRLTEKGFEVLKKQKA